MYIGSSSRRRGIVVVVVIVVIVVIVVGEEGAIKAVFAAFVIIIHVVIADLDWKVLSRLELMMDLQICKRTIYANAPVKTKSAKPNLFGGGGRLGHVPLRARACWRKCWPCAYAPVDSMHLCRIHWFFLLCLSLCGMISLESSGVVLVQVFLNRTTATGHGANQDLTTSKK